MPDAIVASNTSSISITALAAVVHNPAQFLGMHFFNPVPMMALVELIRGLPDVGRDDRGGARVAQRLGKTPIVVRNSPGSS
jgi:3-hydroxybutyryl-CoA dehydrogenase